MSGWSTGRRRAAPDSRESAAAFTGGPCGGSERSSRAAPAHRDMDDCPRDPPHAASMVRAALGVLQLIVGAFITKARSRKAGT